MEIPVALPWTAFAVFWLLFGLLAVGAHALAQPRLTRLDAEQRSTLLFALCALPLVGAAFVAVLGFAPAVGGLVVGRHCNTGIGCTPHVPTLHADAAYAIPLVLVLIGATGAVAWAIAGRLRRSVLLGRLLSAIADSPAEQTDTAADPSPRSRCRRALPFRVIDSSEHFACCTGLLRPRLLVSRGLLATLSPAERDAVLAHEQAHAERRDNLRRLLAAVSLWPVPRRWCRRLLQDLALTTEIVCDREAAKRTGGFESVADALLAMTRQPCGRASGSAFSHGIVNGRAAADARIRALRAGPVRRGSCSLLVALLLFAGAAVTLPSTYFAHHLAEFLLGLPS